MCVVVVVLFVCAALFVGAAAALCVGVFVLFGCCFVWVLLLFLV